MEPDNNTHPHQLNENDDCGEDEEKQPPLKPARKSAENCESETSFLQYANNMSSTIGTYKNPHPQVKVPSKKTSEKKLASKPKAENCSPKRPVETTQLINKLTKVSLESTEESSIDGKSEGAKELCSVDDETNGLKANEEDQQASCDTTLKSKNNSENHGGDPSDDKGTPVDP